MNCNTCFPKGTRILAEGNSWVNIEDIRPGDSIVSYGAIVRVEHVETPILGTRKMLRFLEDDLFWSEEHLFWAKQGSKEWWWSYNPDRWREEVVSGVVVGLLDNFSILSGDDILFAHIDGWVKRTVAAVPEGQFDENTQLYLPVCGGAPIIANGYLVAASADEFSYDYKGIRWHADPDRL